MVAAEHMWMEVFILLVFWWSGLGEAGLLMKAVIVEGHGEGVERQRCL